VAAIPGGLFEGLKVSMRQGWDAHLNAYNVVQLDITGVIDGAKFKAEKINEKAGTGNAANKVAWQSLVVPTATEWIREGLCEIVPDAGVRTGSVDVTLTNAILDVVKATGRKFVFIIDEWDALYRIAEGDTESQEAYADWLRSIFKDTSFTPGAIAGAYMTGILPIKKYNHQSAVSDFNEFTMLDPGPYAPYIGFTEDEVLTLSKEGALKPQEMRRFYDGYTLRYVGWEGEDRRVAIAVETYSPYSVMKAYKNGKVKSYWPSSEAFEGLRNYIDLDLDGLQKKIVRALGGLCVPVDPLGFDNDMVTLDSSDDVLTLLTHLGYLAYDEGPADGGTVRVPNEEVRRELQRAVTKSRHPLLRQVMIDSIALLADVVAGYADNVAAGIAAVHDRDCAPLFYNDEQALRAVVKTALMAAVDHYVRIEEMPGGHGLADIVYIPKPASAMPALVVELKWDKPVDSAIDQIRETRYCKPLEHVGVPVLLIGVTYDSKTREHVCSIEEWVR
jgi:hypothetical protein